MSYPKTRCSYCGTETNNQPSGDGCHTCLKGIMKPAARGVLILGAILALAGCNMTPEQQAALGSTLTGTANQYNAQQQADWEWQQYQQQQVREAQEQQYRLRQQQQLDELNRLQGGY
ncbi:hypothetical protein IB275_30475 [Pseudomonas sp. PDM21]|uniref:hypothetical protein n=1 Tax=Pseudomonas sp. PDM21 TaxID=2769257 RepID=UPI001786CCBC|nr:hypothetical protein [Pseudomonas sp. PDM21]MBD9674942.1 hypothetical protein [Pseudomonas sp. PDM21]